MPPELEARFARSALGLQKSGVSLFKAGPGFQVPWGHRHRDQEEVYLVLSGSAIVQFEDEAVELGEWDAVRIPADVRGLPGRPRRRRAARLRRGEQGDAEMVEESPRVGDHLARAHRQPYGPAVVTIPGRLGRTMPG